jgi:SAM-dependent methyltransferase
MDEIYRIKEAYTKRDTLNKSRIYTYFNPSALYYSQQLERYIIIYLKRNGIDDLSRKHILDVGCGIGEVLRNFIRYRARPENLNGIDLLSDRVEIAKRLSPNINFKCGDASNLPYGDESFDIVLQFTVFTSILDSQMKKEIAGEMLRVLKPDGIIFWYDFHMNNPQNPDVKGVKKKEIYELFPDCSIYLKRITLGPPIARTIAPFSFLACYFLENLRIFNTHYIGIIKKFIDNKES